VTPQDLKTAYRTGALAKPDYIRLMHDLHQQLFDYAEFIKETDIGRIEISDGRIIMVTRDPEIKLITDQTQRRLPGIEILNFDNYETAEMGILRQLVHENDTVLDIGANVGLYTMTLCKTVPQVEVHAFEPVPDTYRSLRAHLELNGITNAYAHNFGFSNEAKRPMFFLPRDSGNASAADLSGEEDIRRVEVELRTVDDFVLSERLRVAVVKCDVEGGELYVLQGARTTLLRDRPVVLTEMLRKWAGAFGYHPNEIIALMNGMGYECLVVRGSHLERFASMDDSTIETNFFFLHAENHARDIARLTRSG
jgi:FkbM family methyltransferase